MAATLVNLLQARLELLGCFVLTPALVGTLQLPTRWSMVAVASLRQEGNRAPLVHHERVAFEQQLAQHRATARLTSAASALQQVGSNLSVERNTASSEALLSQVDATGQVAFAASGVQPLGGSDLIFGQADAGGELAALRHTRRIFPIVAACFCRQPCVDGAALAGCADLDARVALEGLRAFARLRRGRRAREHRKRCQQDCEADSLIHLALI